jgi:hypothetical protein
MPTLKLPRRETLHLGVALSKAILKRAIRFTEAHSGKCETYAGPLHKLSHHKAVGVFWGLFASIIVALLIATYYYAKAQKEADLTKEARQNTDKVSARKHRSIQKQCLIVTLFCFVTGFLFLLFGAFAALNVQWCQGEDLIQFYWGFWILIGIGSEFAMLGIVVHQISALCGHESPPWNVALGTPVLVFAGVSFLWVAVTRKWAGTRIIPRRLRRGNL